MKNHIKKISEKLQSKFFFDYDMSKNVWFRAGGKTSVFCLVINIDELKIILSEIGNFPYIVVGAGSNFLVRDGGYNGIILKLGKGFNQITISENVVNVGSGVLDVNLAKFAEINNIKNFEFYSGIPGSIGGAIKMNAGCFGYETSDILKEVQLINHEGIISNYSKDEINLEYRNSNLPQNSIVLLATYEIKYGYKEEINKKLTYIKEMRKNSQPIKVKTSGSTFKNPKNNFAARLIEESGCKDLRVGDAVVSEKHSNFLINLNKASASDIEELGSSIIDKVYKKFDIKLEWEIKIIG